MSFNDRPVVCIHLASINMWFSPYQIPVLNTGNPGSTNYLKKTKTYVIANSYGTRQTSYDLELYAELIMVIKL